ncbi:MAG TPA: hypothetical protein VH234_02695 [Candidatus Saccharimonadales bacterium]|jgi:uncharacterized membrane-anchored protein|nr:hypothetical protein [Candidatus Saccharimonadales bacterium]
MEQISGLKYSLRRQAWQTLTKVPKITLYFWIVKLLTTAMGEATSDYMVLRFNPYLAVMAGFAVFVIALVIQFRKPHYVAWAYWLAVAMVAVFGTMAADVIHIQFGVPYAISTIFFAMVLAVVFTAWYKSEGTLSIHSVYTRSREAFYWAAVLATFAMGTAAGDLAAYTLHLGFLTSGILFGVVFALPALAYWLFDLNPILSFWLAYIMTRPFGASFADWIGKSHSVGGLAYGDSKVALILTALIVILVAYLGLTGKDQPAHQVATQDRL